MAKTILCRCEDVTEDEIHEAIDNGMTDIESLKRYLAIGTGPCQAKNCMARMTLLLIKRGLLDPEKAAPIVARPPIFMTELKYFAGREEPE
jgi:bacterioferritin-associated ferredoxin